MAQKDATLPNLLQICQPQSDGMEIQVVQEDDDVSKLSFGDNMSYICDLANQKKNRKAIIQQEAFEETQELYEIALQEGGQESRDLFKEIFQLVEAEVIESYKEKDKLLDQRLQVAVQAEIERKNLAKENGPAQLKVDQIDKKIQKEEIKILKKKIKKIRNMVRDVMKDKKAMKNKKKATQLKRLQKKHDNYVEELEKQKKDSDTTATLDTSASLGSVLDSIGKGNESDSDDDDQMGKKKKKKKKKKKVKDKDKDRESDKIPKAERSSKVKSKSKKKIGSESSNLKKTKQRPKVGLATILEGGSKSEKRRSVSPKNKKSTK